MIIKPLLLCSPKLHHPLAIASLSLTIAFAVDHHLIVVFGRITLWELPNSVIADVLPAGLCELILLSLLAEEVWGNAGNGDEIRVFFTLG